MTAIATALIKVLREATWAGPLDGKMALEASGGDLDHAKEALREKGLAKALKQAKRETKAGLVVVKAATGEAGNCVSRGTGERLTTRFQFRELFEKQACDVIQPDLCHCGVCGRPRRSRPWPRPTTWAWRRTTRWARWPMPPRCTLR